MIQAIISPAKQMNVDGDAFAPRGIPPFPRETARVVDELRAVEQNEGAEGLQRLWAVSDKLLAENVERLHDFHPVADARELDDAETSRRVGPAIFSYTGIQYRSMAAHVLGDGALEWLQEHLWILSALYGCARPFDAVQPYRLEMGAKLAIDDAGSLYAFWGRRLAERICSTVGTEVVNLASTEYSKAVLPCISAETPVATCVFSSSLRNGKPVQKSTESKTARGSMVRWMAETGAGRLEDLKRFDVGFAFDPALSHEGDGRATYVFMKR